MPFTVTHTTDMKAAWYLPNKGGGCKTKTFFWHMCPCTKDSLTSFNVENSHCSRFKDQNRQRCYHHEVCDRVRVAEMLDNLDSQLGLYIEKHKKTYHDILTQTKLRTKDMQENNDMGHIDFIIPVKDPEKQRQYSQCIARECYLRGI